MPYRDFLKHINENTGYYRAYRTVECKFITRLNIKLMEKVQGEDGASMKIDYNNYSEILQAYRIFIN